MSGIFLKSSETIRTWRGEILGDTLIFLLTLRVKINCYLQLASQISSPMRFNLANPLWRQGRERVTKVCIIRQRHGPVVIRADCQIRYHRWINYMICFITLQVKNPTVVPGKVANGDLLGLTSWPDIIGSIQGSNPLSAVIVNAVFLVQTTLLCIWRDISEFWAPQL